FDDRIAPRGRAQDQTVDLPAHHLGQGAFLARRIVLGVADNRDIAAFVEYVFDAEQDRRIKRAVDVRHDDADNARSTSAQTGGKRIGAIAEPLGRLEHALGDAVGDLATGRRIHRPRYGGEMHAGGARYLAHGDA